MVKYRNRSLDVTASSLTGSTGFFVGVSLGKTLQSPRLVLVKAWKGMDNVAYPCDNNPNNVEKGVKHHSLQSNTGSDRINPVQDHSYGLCILVSIYTKAHKVDSQQADRHGWSHWLAKMADISYFSRAKYYTNPASVGG